MKEDSLVKNKDSTPKRDPKAYDDPKAYERTKKEAADGRR
jgi:hypothetical protein